MDFLKKDIKEQHHRDIEQVIKMACPEGVAMEIQKVQAIGLKI